MPGFTDLQLQNGVGPVHMNRTRTIIQPAAGREMPNGYAIANNLPQFMDPHTATVFVDHANHWNGEASLCFRGVARIRPFALLQAIPLPVWVPVPPGFPASIPVPEQVRDWLMPDLHTDSVGHVYTPKAHEITVQTLKRQYITADDKKLAGLVETVVIATLVSFLDSNLATAPLSALLAIRRVREFVTSWFVSQAVDLNQRHFLAGRRSFRMGTAAEFGLRGDHWVFETAAVEAYSHWVYQQVTDYAMGGAASAVTPVWVEMGNRVASAFGRRFGQVDHQYVQCASVSEATSSPFFAAISRSHSELTP